MSAHDPLTGLGDHARFREALSEARLLSAVAVVLVDVDGFTALNDTRGAQAGDRVLLALASALSSGLRRGDELFRTGGDEFAALVHVTSTAEALEAGRRLRAAAARTGGVTVSVGVAVPGEHESDAALLERAQRALGSVSAS